MTLPYENATVGDKALGEIQKLLRGFGCKQFGTWVDDDRKEIIIQFNYRAQKVSFKASINGYAQAWLNQNPHTSRMRCTRQEHERKALEKANIAVYSMARDWVKAQVTAIECGILSFEAAFLGMILLPTGQTVLEHIDDQNLLTHKNNNGTQD